MKKILITGFDPFGGETINPALEVVKDLPDKIRHVEIVKLEIPTVFHQSAAILEASILAEQPDIVLCIGQAGGRSVVTLERVAINIDDARIADNNGNQPIDEVIRENGAPAYFSTLPIKAMIKAINDCGIPAQVSNTAGTFVCNHLMYQALYIAEQMHSSFKAGFMHIPYLPSQAVKFTHQPSMSVDSVKQAIVAAIETIILLDGQKDIMMTGGVEC